MTAIRKSAELTLPAITGPWRLASSERVCLARFPVSRHRLGATEFFGLNFGYAASTDVDDDNCVALEGPVSGVNLTLEWIELDPDCVVGDH